MQPDTWICTAAIEITDIKTLDHSYRVVVAETGKIAHLPIEWTTIRPGYAIVPVEIKQRILGLPEA